MSDKVFITKYATTTGILEADINDIEHGVYGVTIKNRFFASRYVFSNREEAIQDAEKQRQRAINRIAKIDYSITKPV